MNAQEKLNAYKAHLLETSKTRKGLVTSKEKKKLLRMTIAATKELLVFARASEIEKRKKEAAKPDFLKTKRLRQDRQDRYTLLPKKRPTRVRHSSRRKTKA